MAKRSKNPPKDEEILSYDNVPLETAAKYIGWSSVTVRYALQEERAPFGCAARNPSTGTWSYNISPGLLLKYKRGEMPVCKLRDLTALVADMADRQFEERMARVRRTLDGMG